MKYKADEFLKNGGGIEAASRTAASTNGDVVDTQQFQEMLVTLNLGVIAGAGTVQIKMQEGDEADGSDQADLAVAAASPVYVAADDQKQYVGRVALGQRKRYMRPVLLQDGVQASVVGVSVTLLGAVTLPVTQDNDVMFSHSDANG